MVGRGCGFPHFATRAFWFLYIGVGGPRWTGLKIPFCYNSNIHGENGMVMVKTFPRYIHSVPPMIPEREGNLGMLTPYKPHNS